MPPVHRLVVYRPKAGHLEQLESILKKHGPVLRDTGLVVTEGYRLYKANDLRRHGEPEPYFVEEFFWKDEQASDLAHQSPAVMAVWETMGPHMEGMTLTTLEALT